MADIAATGMDETPRTLTLLQPIEAHGETLKTLTFAVPDGADLTACGMPPVGASMSIPEFGGYVSGMMARLAKIPPSSVAKMHRMDWIEAVVIILGFFRKPEASEAPPTSISTSDTPSAT